MNTRICIYFLAIAAMISASVSCSEDPTRVGRPPVVEGFSPLDQALDAFTGDTLVFSVRAIDPDRSILRQRFLVGDSLVSGASRWTYVVNDTGLIIVRCVVSDDEYDSHIQWALNRHQRINHPPRITSFSPVEPAPTMIIGTNLEFAVEATDDDDDPITVSFRVDGEKVADDDRFVYTTLDVGRRVVEAVVSDGEKTAVHTWDLLVTGVPDTDPPAEVPIVNLATGVEPGEVDIAWVAVGQNGTEGNASNYLLRTSPSPILTNDDWARASVQPGVPDALPSGQVMSMTIRAMIPGRYTHVAVRALDDFGNLSPIGESPGVYTRGMRVSGRIVDAVTLAPLPGIQVSLGHFETTSDMAGAFEFIELPPLDTSISLRDESVVGDVGDYYDYETDYLVRHLDYLEFYMLPDLALQTRAYSSFYDLYRRLTDTEGIPAAAQQRRMEIPIDIYVPAYSANGLDFRQNVVDVAAEFDQIMGVPMFSVVGELPDVGIEVAFSPLVDTDNYQTVEWSADYYPVKGRVRFRTLYAPATVESFRVIIRHEFGHALGLAHSLDRLHLMIGGQTATVPWFSEDELNVIRAYYHIPRGIDMTEYTVE